METIALDRSISINKQIKNNKNDTIQINNQHHLHANNRMIDHNFMQSQQPLSHKDLDMMMMMMENMNMNMHGYKNYRANYPFYPSFSHPPPLLPLPATAKPAFSSLAPPIRRHSSLSLPPGTANKKPSKKHAGKSHVNSLKADRARPTKATGGESGVGKNRVGPDPEVIFGLSPPPSSLPLPRFSLRQPKRSCKAEAGGVVDDVVHVVADNIRRSLKLG